MRTLFVIIALSLSSFAQTLSGGASLSGAASMAAYAAAAASGDPFLAFTDLASGTNTGNSDTSLGQTANTDGAIVSVWGINLGSTQGTSTISIGGAAARVYYWGPASPPYSPANLANSYQNMQMVIAQIDHTASVGAGSVQVTVGGTTSNALDFTVRAIGSNHIYFAGTGGNDSTGNGSWSNKFLTLKKCKNSMVAGDVCYALAGSDAMTSSTYDDCSAYGMSLAMQTDGTEALPFVLAAYPGQAVQLGRGGSGGGGTCPVIKPYNSAKEPTGTITGGRYVYWWTVAKFTIYGPSCSICIIAPHGARLVGNEMKSDFAANINEGYLQTYPGKIRLYGNEPHNIGPFATAVSEYHVFYIAGWRAYPNAGNPLGGGSCDPTNGCATNSVVGATDAQVQLYDAEWAWNYHHDNGSDTAYQLFNGGNDNHSWPMGGTKLIHDNVIVDQAGDCIKLGTSTAGENWVYNNYCLRGGRANTNNPNRNGIDVRGGDGRPASETSFHIWNNTLIDIGETGVAGNSVALLLYQSNAMNPQHPPNQLDLHNNIFLQGNAFPYIKFDTDYTPITVQDATKYSNNAWYGCSVSCGSISWDSSSVTANPLLVDNAGTDPRLSSSSPLIDAGTSTTQFTRDMDSRPRPQRAAWDIGAYEKP